MPTVTGMGAAAGPLRRRGRDVAVAGAAAVAGIALVAMDSVYFGHLAGLPRWALAGLQVVAASTLFARRSAPLTVAAVNAALAVPTATAAAVVAAYAAVAHGVGTARVRAVTVALVVVAARPWKVAVSRAGDDDVTVHLQLMLFPVVIAALLGWRHRRARARDAQAARDRELVAEQARVDERARLAAEMHDVITHRVSLMVLQAGALQVSTTDDTVRRHADELRRSGRQALRELRDLLSVIRDEAPDGQARSPEPAVLDVADLVAATRGVGIPVELVTSGAAPLLSTVVVRAAYRVVQEALTNVHKHAPGATVWLAVRYDADNLRLTIRNTAPARPGTPGEQSLAGTGANGGLHGLRRRVELVNGSLRAGPRPDGGFEVLARLPTGAAE
jgi:signal transduction histidine kinase